MKNLDKILKAFANKRRLAIIKYLKNAKQASVGDIAEEIHLSFRSTSKHLGILFAADIVDKEQKGSYLLYRISDQQNQPNRTIISLL